MRAKNRATLAWILSLLDCSISISIVSPRHSIHPASIVQKYNGKTASITGQFICIIPPSIKQPRLSTMFSNNKDGLCAQHSCQRYLETQRLCITSTLVALLTTGRMWYVHPALWCHVMWGKHFYDGVSMPWRKNKAWLAAILDRHGIASWSGNYCDGVQTRFCHTVSTASSFTLFCWKHFLHFLPFFLINKTW